MQYMLGLAPTKEKLLKWCAKTVVVALRLPLKKQHHNAARQDNAQQIRNGPD